MSTYNLGPCGCCILTDCPCCPNGVPICWELAVAGVTNSPVSLGHIPCPACPDFNGTHLLTLGNCINYSGDKPKLVCCPSTDTCPTPCLTGTSFTNYPVFTLSVTCPNATERVWALTGTATKSVAVGCNLGAYAVVYRLTELQTVTCNESKVLSLFSEGGSDSCVVFGPVFNCDNWPGTLTIVPHGACSWAQCA